MRKIKYTLLIPLISFSLILSGCWDNVDIDRKIFISTIAIDPGKDISNKEKLKGIKSDEPFQEDDIKRLKVVFGFPDISKTGSIKGGSAEEQFIKTEAYSVEDAISSAVARSSRNIFLGQSKLLILSNELIKYPDVFKEVMDYFQREPRRNRMMYIVVAEGNAEQFVNYKAPMEKNIEAYISGMMENTKESSTILPITLNEVVNMLSENGEAIIPTIKYDKEKNQIFLSGIAFINKYKIVGTLNEAETGDLEILRGKLKGGKKTVFVNNHPVDILLDGDKRELILADYNKKQKKLHFKVNIKLEGSLKEYYLFKGIYENNAIEVFQNYFNKSISEECERVIGITKQEFKSDPIGFRENIEKYHPQIWDEIKGNWDEVYKNAQIDVNVKTYIRRNGVTK